MHQEQMRRSGGTAFAVQTLVRYDQRGQTVAVELTPDEKKKLEEDQRRFAL